MPLTNSQYDSLFREYEQKQNKSRYALLQRTDEIYRRIPEYEEIEHSISSISVAQAKKLLDGDENAVTDLKKLLAQLSAKKRELLLSHGYAADFLEPVYECPDCRDTGYQGNVKCHCFRRKIISLLYAQSNMEALLKKENFSTLSYDFYQGEDLARFENAVTACHDFIRCFRSSYRNLLFYGQVGAGKSFLSNCIARELIEQGYSVIYFSAVNLFDTLAQNSFSGKSKEELYSVQEDLYNCDLLLIDDLGTEYTNSYITSKLFSYLNERHLRRKSTLISTNLSLEDLRNRYSERIFSRITSNYDIYKITGPDIRMYRKTMINRK